MADVDRLGGPEGVAAIVAAFVDAVRSDFIIGFFFEGRDRDRIVKHELELAMRHLGGESVYTGRPLPAVHKPLGIHHGHFQRRIAVLRTVLLANDVPPDIVERWIAHDLRLESAVTVAGDCVP